MSFFSSQYILNPFLKLTWRTTSPTIHFWRDHKPWYPATGRRAPRTRPPAQRIAVRRRGLHRRAWRSSGTSTLTAECSWARQYLPRSSAQTWRQQFLHDVHVTQFLVYSKYTSIYTILLSVQNVCQSYLILMALPCKPGSQKGATCHRPCLWHCSSPYRKHTPCPVRNRLSVCSASNPQSVALETKSPLILSMKVTQFNKHKVKSPYKYLCQWALVRLCVFQTCGCQHTPEIQSV